MGYMEVVAVESGCGLEHAQTISDFCDENALPLALAKCPGLSRPFALKISPAASDSPGRPAELFDPPRLAPL